VTSCCGLLGCHPFCNRVGSSSLYLSDSYSKDVLFESRQGYRISWVNILCFSSVATGKMQDRLSHICFLPDHLQFINHPIIRLIILVIDIVAFLTSYLVERGSSVVMQLLSKQRHRLQITQRGDPRLLLSDIKPDIGKLVSLLQANPSR
jgi:hypothetical protein